MEKSLFVQWVDKYFEPIVRKIVETINGDKSALTYLFKTMLIKTYSTSLKWGSLSSKNIVVAADVVSMDSELPLKRRPAMSKAEGDIPKLGMKLYLNEKQLSDLDTLERKNDNGSKVKQILKNLFADSKRCITGINEQLEYMFQQALSTGVMVIADENREGLGIRIDFLHPDENKYGVQVPWSVGDDTVTAIDDIENVMANARKNGDTIRYAMMDRNTFNQLRKSKQVKELYASSLNFAGDNPPTPNLSQLNEAMQANYGFTIELVERTVNFENQDGTRVTKKPWADNVVVFLTEMQVGDLSWGDLAESNHPVDGVQYQTVDDYILLSKYRKNDPLREFTASQAIVIPVINNVDSIYIMDSEEAATDEQTEGDADFTYTDTEGTTDDYTRTSVIDAINLANPDGPAAVASNKDATLQKKINALSDAQIVIFEENIVASV